MQQHDSKYFPEDTPSTLGVGSKGQNIFFLKSIMLNIRIMGVGCIAH